MTEDSLHESRDPAPDRKPARPSGKPPVVDALISTVGCVVGPTFVVLGFGSCAIHIWAVLIAHEASGLLAAGLTFLTPIASWVYWARQLSAIQGDFWQPFNIALVAEFLIIVILAVFVVVAGIVAQTERS